MYILKENIDKIHTTDMGVLRIKKNLKLDSPNVVDYLKDLIIKSNNIYLIEKNYYCEIDNIIITINKYSYTIITAHRKDYYEKRKSYRSKEFN